MEAKAPKPLPVYSANTTPDGCAILRNNAALNTPAGKPFVVPTPKLADAILAEWRAQGDKPNPAQMPLTQLASTAIDIVEKDRAMIIGQVAAYAASELLCYRADQPPELPELQQHIWQPLLDWCAKKFRAPLAVGAGIVPLKQPAESLKALHDVTSAYDTFHLTGIRHAVDVSGSFVVGLALAEGHITAEQAFEAAELDTIFQMKKWGEDPVTLARHAGVKRDLEICERWFGLLKK